jgi:hypothetical protein
VQVWFSNRRARLRKTLGSASSTFPAAAPGLASYAASEASFPAHSGYQWASTMASSAYLNYGGYCQEKAAAQYYPAAAWPAAAVKGKEGMGGQGLASASWAPGGAGQDYNSLLGSYGGSSGQAGGYQGEQAKYLSGGLGAEGKYGMGEAAALETKYASQLASHAGHGQQEEKHQQYLSQLAAQSMCRPVH